MKTRYKSKRGRKTNKNTRRKKQSYKSTGSSKRGVVLFILVISLIIGILYKIAPDAIIIETNLKDQQRDDIKSIVREVLKEEDERKQKEALITTSEPNIVEETATTDTNEARVEENSVTSRSGLAINRKEQPVDNSLQGYRITSYYPGDGCLSTGKTGSGKTTSDFGTKVVAGKTVYTYKDKIVVAAATKELLNTGYSVKGSQESQVKHYFKYYDELQIDIDGTLYDAIVLDSCGAAMWKGEYRIDIYVPNASNVINRSNVTAYYNI